MQHKHYMIGLVDRAHDIEVMINQLSEIIVDLWAKVKELKVGLGATIMA